MPERMCRHRPVEAVDAAVDEFRLAARRALAGEIETRIRAAIAGGHLPEQDAGAAAVALTGLLIEGLIGPLAKPVDSGKMRETRPV